MISSRTAPPKPGNDQSRDGEHSKPDNVCGFRHVMPSTVRPPTDAMSWMGLNHSRRREYRQEDRCYSTHYRSCVRRMLLAASRSPTISTMSHTRSAAPAAIAGVSAQRTVNPGEVVVHEVERDGSSGLSKPGAVVTGVRPPGTFPPGSAGRVRDRPTCP